MPTARSTTAVPSFADAPVVTLRGPLPTSAVVRVTATESMAETLAPAAMMSTIGAHGLGDLAAAATQSVTAALATLTTNAQEA